jgi:hypothetical protein
MSVTNAAKTHAAYQLSRATEVNLTFTLSLTKFFIERADYKSIPAPIQPIKSKKCVFFFFLFLGQEIEF